MNKHIRALLVIIGIVILIFVGVFVWQKRADSLADEKSANSKIEINKTLPDFTTKTLKAAPLKLSDLKGKVVILNFWASWCGPCVEEMPSLIKLVKEFPQDVELVAVSGDSTRQDIDSFVKSFPELTELSNIHMIWDEDKSIMQTYEIYRLPESFVLDRNQKLVKRLSGSIDWHSVDAIKYMKELTHPATK